MTGPPATVDAGRREFLGSAAAVSATALAGCSGVLDDGNGGDQDGGTDGSWAEWAPVEFVVDRTESEVTRIDPDRYREQFSAEMRSTASIDQIESQLGLSTGALDLVVQINESPATDHTVFLGEVDPAAVEAALDVEAGSRYQGYDVIGGQMAVTDGVIVSSSEFRTIIDAKDGTGETVLDAGGEWPAAAEHASSQAMGVVEPAPERPWAVEASTATGTDGGDAIRLTVYAHFDSAERAEANREAVRDVAGMDTDSSASEYGVESVSIRDNVVVLVGTIADHSF